MQPKILLTYILERNRFKQFVSPEKQLKYLMKKFAFKTVAVVLFISTLFSSCSNDDGGENIIVKKQEITSVVGPETATIGEQITLTVTYKVDNSCGVFQRFFEITNGNSKTIDIEARYEGENCGTTETTLTQPYQVSVITPGTYNFKFRKTGTQFITHTVVITE